MVVLLGAREVDELHGEAAFAVVARVEERREEGSESNRGKHAQTRRACRRRARPTCSFRPRRARGFAPSSPSALRAAFPRARIDWKPSFRWHPGGRLAVVSNRFPFRVRKGRHGAEVERSSGGLVAALEPGDGAGRRHVGRLAGRRADAARSPPSPGGFELAPIALSAQEVRLYYHGLSNRTLWPLLHSFPTRMELDRTEWLAYEAVNERFAERAAELVSPARWSGSTTTS